MHIPCLFFNYRLRYAIPNAFHVQKLPELPPGPGSFHQYPMMMEGFLQKSLSPPWPLCEKQIKKNPPVSQSRVNHDGRGTWLLVSYDTSLQDDSIFVAQSLRTLFRSIEAYPMHWCGPSVFENT